MALIGAISYGPELRFRGKGFLLPQVHILWAATPSKEGVSDVDIFFVFEDKKGIFAKIRKMGSFILTGILLTILQDDDVKAFPHMRFNLGHLTKGDESVAELAELLERVPISPWSSNV